MQEKYNLNIYVHLIIILLFTIFLLKKIIGNIILPEYYENKWWNAVNKLGLLEYLENRYVYFLVYVLSTIYAYLYANFQILWLIIAILLIIIFVINILMLKTFSEDELKTPKLTKSILERNIKGRKIFALLNILLLAIWLYSWWFLLIDILA